MTADNDASVDVVSPIVFQCERCGLPASLGAGLVCSVIAAHLNMQGEFLRRVNACHLAGGPFSDGDNAHALEEKYRSELGLPFLRKGQL